MGGEEKVTEMLLKVDLDCYSCYKKIKKTLCKFPQIRDQVYDEKNNTVKITVVCCSPDKIRDKLCCKGGSSIKSIEILEASKPKPKEPEKKPKEPEKKPEKPKEPEKPKPPQPKEPDQKPKQVQLPPEKPKDNGKPKPAPAPGPGPAPAPEKPKDNGKPKEPEKPKPKPQPQPQPQPAPQAAVPMPVQPQNPAPVPTMMATQVCPMDFYSSCGQCYGGGGPCCHGYGMPVVPQQCYDNRGNAYGYPYGNGGGGGGYYGYNNNTYQRCNLDRCCEYYMSEENPSSCAIM